TTFVNPKMAQMLGYTVEEMMGMSIFAFMDEEGKKIAHDNVQRRRQGMSEQHDFKFRCRDGSDLWAIVSTTPIFDEAGQYIGALGMVTDISSRRALERELALREARLNAFFAAAPIGMVIVDPQLRYVQINEPLAQINGQPVNEHIGKPLDEIIPDIAPKVKSIYQQVLTTGKPILNQEVTGQVPSKPGVQRYWLVSYFPISDSDGGFSGVGGIVVEISDRKKAEQALKESQLQYQSLVDVLPQCLYRTDTEGKITFGNRAFLSTLNKTLEECLGKTVYDFYPQDLADKYTADNETVIQTGVTLDLVDIHQAPADDLPIYIQVIKSPVRDENGQIIGTQGIFWDVTERQQAEQTLRWQEALLRSMANASPLAFFVVDNRTDAILYFNHRFCEIWGLLHLEELMQRGELKNNDIIPDCLPILLDVPAFAESCKPLQSEKNRVVVEDEIPFVDGRTIRRFSAQIRDKQDHYFGRLYLFEDISDRKQAEANLQQALEAAEVANRAKSTFLASTSHELRTPLNAILGFAQLMSHSSSLSPEHKKHIGIIHQSGEHLLNLINNVLDMSKIEADSIVLKETNFDLYCLLDDLEAMFHLKALEKKLQLVFEYSTNVPQYLCTDQLKLSQVLINLLNNAIKFTQKGSVTLRVLLSRRGDEGDRQIGRWGDGEMGRWGDEEMRRWGDGEMGRWGDGGDKGASIEFPNNKQQTTNNKQQTTNNKQQTTIYFQVEDTGVGITPEELETIFEPFVQASTSQQFQEGTGLGLAISRKFVELMGGHITVSSKVGNGTLFQFELPVRVVEAAALETKQQTRRVIALEPNQPCYRILITDDRDYNRQLLINLLSPLGFEVREACNGKEAVEIWESWQPHLIWMDLWMPVMDGYEATQEIRCRETRRRGDGEMGRWGDGEAEGEEKTRETRRQGNKEDKGENMAIYSSQFPIPYSQITNNKGQTTNNKQQITNTIIIALTASSPEEERGIAIASGCNDFIRKPFRESEIFEAMKQQMGVRYIYEEVAGEGKSLPTESDSQRVASTIGLASQEHPQGTPILSPAAFASLPADWLANFQQATVEGDLDLMLTLIEQIRQQNNHLADALASLANQFQFEELLALIEE
ncbi:MAG: PAS domain S-box protein, partial [Symploca sp. SIO1B1]|nr:PAS domain S-box protein [Symploca sp. SIO1B1]